MNLYAIPPYVLLAVAIVVAPIVVCSGQWYVHGRLQLRAFLADNDVAGFIIAVVGTLYAVLLGFMTVQVWQHYETARLHVWAETSSAADVWHDAVGLPAADRSRVRTDMLSYARTMIDDEWPAMKSGRFAVRGDELIMDATTVVGQLVPANAGVSNAQSAVLARLNELHDARATRLATNAEAISGFQWTVLFIGAIVVLAFCYVFSVSNLGSHLLMTASVTILIATMFVLLFELQYPFRSQLGITTEAWNVLITHIDSMDRMPGPMSQMH